MGPTVQLASKFTLNCEHSHERSQNFKSARELLASARASLAEPLLVNYLRVHAYCTSAKYSRAFVHVRTYVTRTSALASNANTCHGTYVFSRAQHRLHRFKLSSGLLVKPSIHQKEFY